VLILHFKTIFLVSDYIALLPYCHTKSEIPKEMLKTSISPGVEDILRDSIKLLCQNSIVFNAQITIQALIGITVDGAEVLLVNLHEQIDKCKKHNNLERPVAPWSSSVCDVKFECHDDDCIEIPIDAKLNLEEQKQDGDEDFEELNANYAKDEDYTENANQELEYNEPTEEYNDGNNQDLEPTIKNEYAQNRNEYAPHRLSANSVQSGTGKRRKTVHRVVGSRQRQQQRLTASGDAAYDGGLNGYQQSYSDTNGAVPLRRGSTTVTVLPTEVTERSQVFTCSICGQSVRHLSSFLRHKKQHDGTVFRCDICGQVVNRRDSLIKHRRRCEQNCMARDEQWAQ